MYAVGFSGPSLRASRTFSALDAMRSTSVALRSKKRGGSVCDGGRSSSAATAAGQDDARDQRQREGA